MSNRFMKFFAAIALSIGVAAPLFATQPLVLNQEIAARLERGADKGETFELRDIPLVDGEPATLQLERFEVWAPDAQIIVYEKDGKTSHTVPRPQTRFYKGTVNGNRDSAVEITVGRNGRIAGSIFVGDRMFSIGRGVAHLERGTRAPLHEDDVNPIDRSAPLMVREFDPVEDLINNPGAGEWRCDLDQEGMSEVRLAPRPRLSSDALTKTTNGTPSSGVSYSLNLAIETDGELWAAFGSDASELTYLQDLIAKASVIYQRDLSTALTIGTVHQWSNSSTDPWTVAAGSGTGPALAEFGTYWHNNYSGVTRSSVVFMSGKLFSGGVGWIDVLCSGDFYCGADGSSCNGGIASTTWAGKYGGGYAFCGSSGSVNTSTPDPTATVNGVQYGLPTSNYWPLLEVTHELGHNANGPHTHCIPLDSTQQTTYGVVGRTYVDLCADQGGCYGGTTSSPAELGTIMSYCHLFSVGGYRQSRYRFYKSGEANELIQSYFASGLNNGTSGLDATITIGSNLSCAAGQTASVPSNGSATFSWQISGGTITSSTTSNSITFTPSASSVTVTVTVKNSSGCAIINSATASTQCGAISPPATVTATGSTTGASVSVSWSSVSGATSYTVYRSTNNSTWTSAGTTASTNLTDSGVSVNTAYMYKVTATGPGGTSGDSPKDLATPMNYTDPTIVAHVSPIKAVDITQLRTAVNAVRKLANGGVANDYSFTDPTVTVRSTVVKRIHIIDLRTALDAARSTLGMTPISYSDSTITIHSTPVRTAHITDLRAGVQ